MDQVITIKIHPEEYSTSYRVVTDKVKPRYIYFKWDELNGKNHFPSTPYEETINNMFPMFDIKKNIDLTNTFKKLIEEIGVRHVKIKISFPKSAISLTFKDKNHIKHNVNWDKNQVLKNKVDRINIDFKDIKLTGFRTSLYILAREILLDWVNYNKFLNECDLERLEKMEDKSLLFLNFIMDIIFNEGEYE